MFATAFAAPVSEPHAPLALPAGWNGLGLGAGWNGLGLGLGLHAGAIAAPAIAAPLAVAAPAIALPAPYTTSHVAGPDTVSVHQPAPVITKQLQYADRSYVAAFDTTVIKPVIGDIDIAVPTALLGTVSHNAPITRVSKEPFIVNEPVPVERRFDVPYEVLKHETRIIEVPTPVHVDQPYNVYVPTPVVGEPIIQKVVGPPVVHHSHEHVAAPAIHTGAIHAPFAGVHGLAGWGGLAGGQVIAAH